ncbi:hypothetical protein GIB67_015937 [Kingdonia uniflora]|uniref:Uncharacterized protein n=1 Tax=Kingdonia uniflora TaxID=39325 RepID=A0A7J7PCQ7_9MAGN|nr:hypothetical protein GIB67_015937 [Kingdonia uniflora]
MSWQRLTPSLSLFIDELIFGFISLSLSSFVGCGVCGVLLLIAIRVWWSITVVWSALI